MKITRKTLLGITAFLGILIILYALLRQFSGIELGEDYEKLFMDVIFFGAMGIFIYNRKMASDERKAKEAAERLAAENQDASSEDVSSEDNIEEPSSEQL